MLELCFYGYDRLSSKDHEHLRRSGTKSTYVTVNKDSKCHKNQESLLSNVKNKTQFIELLMDLLKSRGHYVQRNDGDADRLVATSLKLSQNKSVVVVAEDTDIHNVNPSLEIKFL